METSDLFRLISILVSIVGIVILVFMIAPRQIDDMKLVNGYRGFKRRLNWLSVSLIVLLGAHISIDVLRLEDCPNELVISFIVALRSTMALLIIWLVLHLYNYKCPEEKHHG
jgi:hypothetical protein